jgi:hypothetical protein
MPRRSAGALALRQGLAEAVGVAAELEQMTPVGQAIEQRRRQPLVIVKHRRPVGELQIGQLRSQDQVRAAECLERDWEDFVTFFDFPEEHWVHLKTSNPIESIFNGVKLRTNATKRMKVRENALYLVFKLVCRASLNWRAINAPNQLALLLTGHRFDDGKPRINHPTQEDAAA